MVTVAPSKRFRAYFVQVLLVSLGLAGVMGIWVLLTGTFGLVEGKILATTMLLGLFSLFSLCHLTQVGKQYQTLGLLGVIATSISLVFGLYIIWSGNFLESEFAWKGFLVAGITGVSLAHHCLLLLLADAKGSVTQILLLLTAISIGVVAFMLAWPVITEFQDIPESYWRVLGVFAILDVVGTVATPIVARLNKN